MNGLRLRWQRFFYFSFYFLFCLNLWKIMVNHKMENLILLYSTWVEICSEHIIWYNLLIFLLLYIHFNLINLYLNFLSTYCEIFMVAYSLNDWAVAKLSYSLDHICPSYSFRSLISNYIRLFSFSRINDTMTMKFLLQLKNVISSSP